MFLLYMVLIFHFECTLICRLQFIITHTHTHTHTHKEVEGHILESPWLSIRLSVDTILYRASDSFVHTTMKFIHNVCVHMKLCMWSIFMTILSLVVELSPLELVNFTELLLSRKIILQYCMYLTQSYTQCYW